MQTLINQLLNWPITSITHTYAVNNYPDGAGENLIWGNE